MTYFLNHRARLFAAILAFGLAAAPAAQAFTFEGAEGAARPPQNFMDLGSSAVDKDKPATKFGGEKTTVEQGNFSLQFGNQRTFHQRYDFNSQFDRYNPVGRQ